MLLLSRFSRVRLCATLETAAHQALPSLGFSRQEHWSGLPFPSPMHESEKWKWSHLVVSDSSRPHGLQPASLLCPWDSPGKSTGVGCHCLLHVLILKEKWLCSVILIWKNWKFVCKWIGNFLMFKSINISERLYKKNVITYVRKVRIRVRRGSMPNQTPFTKDTEAERNYRNSNSSPVWILYSGSRIPISEWVHLIIL